MAPIYKINIKKIGCLFKRILLKNRVEIFLFFYFILMFIFYSWTTITNSQSLIHVDDREIWLVSHNIYKNHSLTYEEPLNKYFEHKVFNTFETLFVDNKVVPRRALGIYFLTAFSFLFGENGPFFMISILGLACSIFFYLLIRNLFDKKIVLLSTVLFSSSFPMIHWSNMLFNNIPAFSFYIIGLFFFSEILVKKKNKIIFYLLSSIFFSLSIWIRYEYFLFVLLLIVWILKDRKSINFKYLMISIMLLIIILFPILLLNNYLYKSPFLIGYFVRTDKQTNRKSLDKEYLPKSTQKHHYTPGKDLGYFIWKTSKGIWKVRWSGNETRHSFTGTIFTDGSFNNIKKYSFDPNDSANVSNTIINFNAKASTSQDGLDFNLSNATKVTFDIKIDNTYKTDKVYIEKLNNNPTEIPFTLDMNLSQINIKKLLPKHITKIIKEFKLMFSKFLSRLSIININVIVKNYKNFIFDIFPQILPFAFIGIIYAMKSKDKNIVNFTIYIILIQVLWLYYIMRHYHFGGESAMAGASMIRYLFITYSFMIVYSTFLIFKLFKRFPDRLIHFITILIIIGSILNTINLSFFGALGMVKTHEIKKNINQIDTVIKSLPLNSIIINDTFNFAIGIRNRKVFDMLMIYSPAIIDGDSLNPKTNDYEVVSTTIKYIKILLDLNYPVYVLEKNHFNLVKNIDEKEEILDTKKVISEDYFEIYKIFYREKY